MDTIDVTLALESGPPELSRGLLLLFGEGVGSSLGRVLVDWGEEVSEGAIKGRDERTWVSPVLFCGKGLLFVIDCSFLEVVLVKNATPVVVATATLAEGLVEARLWLGAVPHEGTRKGGALSASHEGMAREWVDEVEWVEWVGKVLKSGWRCCALYTLATARWWFETVRGPVTILEPVDLRQDLCFTFSETNLCLAVVWWPPNTFLFCVFTIYSSPRVA
jgi:hypothetical protein